MNRHSRIPACLLALALGLGVSSLSSAQPRLRDPLLSFSPAGPNDFTFDTGVVRGNLNAKGRGSGLSSVVHVPTGQRLDGSMGLFSLYRVFSAGKRYGTAAWDWPNETKMGLDGSVEIRWPATNDRPFLLRARYRWPTTNILDLEIAVQAQTNLPRFECFLASYWTPDFSNSVVCIRDPQKPNSEVFKPAEPNLGYWLAFPRDEAASAIIRDGRWKIQPNPVDWVLLSPFARPLGYRRAPALGLTSVLMSPPSDCFAIMTPQQSDPHNSMYLSLFGQDLKEKDVAKVRARLIIGSKLSDADMLRLAEAYGK